MTDEAPDAALSAALSAEEMQRHARSFGPVAEAYDRGRPGYPAEAVTWLTSDQPLSVLELGAGTGKLTEALVALGHDVHATEPDEAMLEVLRRRLPDVRTSLGGAEEVDAPDAAYDVVVAAQSFHWFDHARALPEIQRVLRPGGRLSLVWNVRDERIPWVRKLGRVIGGNEVDYDPTGLLEGSLKFVVVEQAEFGHWQGVDRQSIQDLVASRSMVAVLGEEERAARIRDALALYDDYGRGMDGMQLPYLVRCYRARVVKRRDPEPAPAAPAEARDAGSAGTDQQPDAAAPPDDDGTVLIDFR